MTKKDILESKLQNVLNKPLLYVSDKIDGPNEKLITHFNDLNIVNVSRLFAKDDYLPIYDTVDGRQQLLSLIQEILDLNSNNAIKCSIISYENNEVKINFAKEDERAIVEHSFDRYVSIRATAYKLN
jgi:hypothetical protein